MSEDDVVELGVQLLSQLQHEELTLAETIDRIETITTNPTVTRKILDEADRKGIIERENGIVMPRRGHLVSFESPVITRDGDFTCQRCGAPVTEGYFLQLEAGEHGPFGSSCIKKVTGEQTL